MNKEQLLAIIQGGHTTDGDLADALLAELAKVQEPVGYRYISPDGGWSFSEMKHGDFASPVYSHPVPSVPKGWTLFPTDILDAFPEINPSNYDHVDACRLNSWGVELVLAARDEK